MLNEPREVKAARIYAIRWPNGAGSIEERLRSSVMVDQNSGCWLWEKALFPNGYGQFKAKGTNVGAHRASFEVFVGPIPRGMTIDHKCRVRACINPDHLDCVTQAENLKRAEPHSKHHNRNKGFCKYGHPFSPENTRWRATPPRGRICIKCQCLRTAADRVRRFLADE